jgi:hypothetical protein
MLAAAAIRNGDLTKALRVMAGEPERSQRRLMHAVCEHVLSVHGRFQSFEAADLTAAERQAVSVAVFERYRQLTVAQGRELTVERLAEMIDRAYEQQFLNSAEAFVARRMWTEAFEWVSRQPEEDQRRHYEHVVAAKLADGYAPLRLPWDELRREHRDRVVRFAAVELSGSPHTALDDDERILATAHGDAIWTDPNPPQDILVGDESVDAGNRYVRYLLPNHQSLGLNPNPTGVDLMRRNVHALGRAPALDRLFALYMHTAEIAGNQVWDFNMRTRTRDLFRRLKLVESQSAQIVHPPPKGYVNKTLHLRRSADSMRTLCGRTFEYSAWKPELSSYRGWKRADRGSWQLALSRDSWDLRTCSKCARHADRIADAVEPPDYQVMTDAEERRAHAAAAAAMVGWLRTTPDSYEDPNDHWKHFRAATREAYMQEVTQIAFERLEAQGLPAAQRTLLGFYSQALESACEHRGIPVPVADRDLLRAAMSDARPEAPILRHLWQVAGLADDRWPRHLMA